MPTVLIVDDAISSRKEIKRILEEAGVFTRFFEAENGGAGLQVLSEIGEGIDVVICDRIMPRMDGHKFLESVRRDASISHVPVVMLSEETKLKDIVKAFELGAYDFVSKPILPPILCARLKAILHTKQLQDQLKLQKQMMEKIATTDPLAQIPNVRFFQRRLEDEVNRTFRYKSPVNLVMIDIDHFKPINDTYGHPRGDTVIKELAANLQGAMRNVDLVARYGGEEFVVLLPQTDREGAALVAERLRERAEEHHFSGLPEDVRVTISVGVAHYDGQSEMKSQDLVDAADQALYEAKKKGRNRVVLAWENKP